MAEGLAGIGWEDLAGVVGRLNRRNGWTGVDELDFKQVMILEEDDGESPRCLGH